MKAALRGEDVLCGDESPVNVLTNDLDETSGEPVAGPSVSRSSEARSELETLC